MSNRRERRVPARRVLLMLALAAVGACSEADRAQDFASLAGPGGAVLTTTVVEPWFPQGPHQVVVYIQAAADAPRVEVARAKLAYDGVPFTKGNINMSWTGARSAVVCLRATDRPDRSVHVSLGEGGAPSADLRDGC